MTGTTAPDLKTLSVSGKGIVFSIQTALVSGVPTYGPVAELKSLAFSGAKNDSEDVTNFDSNGRAKEFIVTLLDAGDVSIAGNYITSDSGQAAFRAGFASGSILYFKITLPLQGAQVTTGETWVFQGFVQELDNDFHYDKAITFSSKVKITGLIVVTAGT